MGHLAGNIISKLVLLTQRETLYVVGEGLLTHAD